MKVNTDFQYKMGLIYLSGPLIESDLSMIKTKLSKNEIEFQSIDKNGSFTASFEDFTNVYSFFINSPLALGLVSGVIASATWESIKLVVLHTFKKIRGKKYNKITRNGIEEKDITFGIEIKINNDHYNFNFNGVSSDEAFSEALDKIFLFLKSTQQAEEPNKTTISGLPNHIVTYDEKTNIWIARSSNEIIKEQIEKSK